MERLYFDTHKNLANYMYDKASHGCYTVAVLFHDDAMRLIRELLKNDEIHAESISIESEAYNGYDKEYYVSLADDKVACVEPAYRWEKYLSTDADLTLIDENASSAIIKGIDPDKCLELYREKDSSESNPDIPKKEVRGITLTITPSMIEHALEDYAEYLFGRFSLFKY